MTAIGRPRRLISVKRTAGPGATSPFAEASLNDRLPYAYLPLVRRGKVLE